MNKSQKNNNIWEESMAFYPIKPKGRYVIENGISFDIYKKPNYLHRLFCKLFLLL